MMIFFAPMAVAVADGNGVAVLELGDAGELFHAVGGEQLL